MFSTPETSVHVQDKNSEISPLERERGRLRGKGSGEKVSLKTRMEDPVKRYSTADSVVYVGGLSTAVE